MKAELRNQILAFNRTRAENEEKANDLMMLLSALPPGQVKQLLKDEACKTILEKYGITEIET